MHNPTIERYVARNEAILRDLVASADIPAPRIKEAMEYSLFSGGKRIRPILVYLCGELLGVDVASLDWIAAAIELMHCYSLIHDDLPAMDNDDYRRGKPTCHRAFDEATAILVGDGMQAFALDILLTHLPKSQPLINVLNIAKELLHACGPAGMVSGQSLDLSELLNPNINEQQLRHIHMLKTGKLMMACINMVLLAGNPSPSSINALQQFSSDLGLVFQMQDDYLDQYSDTACLGKGRASDAANQKTTFANLYGKNELFALITQYFQYAKNALKPFKTDANELLRLMDMLQNRIQYDDI